MSLDTTTNVRPLIPGGDVIYTQTPTPEGLVTQERPGQADSWELASQEEALADAGNAVTVHVDGAGQNAGSATAAAAKMNAPAQAQNQTPAAQDPELPKITLYSTVFCVFASLATAGSGVILTLGALDQLPRNPGHERREPGEFETLVTLAVGFFASAIAATASAVACGVRHYRERDSQAAAVATV